MSEAYLKKLRDPRWQKLRLEIFEREGWKCQCCGRSRETLNVHHLIYSQEDPWDEPPENLECLCDGCHTFRTEWDRHMDCFFDRTEVSTKFCLKWCVEFVKGRNKELQERACLKNVVTT